MATGVSAGGDGSGDVCSPFGLGHESVETTQIYLDADLALKERALSKTAPIDVKGVR
jgi:hypothetical protein